MHHGRVPSAFPQAWIRIYPTEYANSISHGLANCHVCKVQLQWKCKIVQNYTIGLLAFYHICNYKKMVKLKWQLTIPLLQCYGALCSTSILSVKIEATTIAWVDNYRQQYYSIIRYKVKLQHILCIRIARMQMIANSDWSFEVLKITIDCLLYCFP